MEIMKNAVAVLVVVSMVAFSSPVFAQYGSDKGGKDNAMQGSDKMMDKGSMPGMDEATMAKMKEFSTPGEGHRVLDPLVGQWQYAMKWWMTADATPQESTGSSQAKWILDGHFLQEDVTGMSMGQPFTGMGVTGYDNLKKKYDSIWLDNMGTGMMISDGSYDAANKTLTFKGTFSCPIENGPRTSRGVLKITGDDSHTYEMYMTDKDGKEFKAMEITYTRMK